MNDLEKQQYRRELKALNHFMLERACKDLLQAIDQFTDALSKVVGKDANYVCWCVPTLRPFRSKVELVLSKIVEKGGHCR